MYGLHIYAYYLCHLCNKPYFGGQRRCEAANANAGGADTFDDSGLFANALGEGFVKGVDAKESEYICGSCSGNQGTVCAKHGTEYMMYKCRFCCSVATWFCWGTTHFCNPCHTEQAQGVYLSKLTPTDLPQCAQALTLETQLKGATLVKLKAEAALKDGGVQPKKKGAIAGVNADGSVNMNTAFKKIQANATSVVHGGECKLNKPHPLNGVEFALGCSACLANEDY